VELTEELEGNAKCGVGGELNSSHSSFEEVTDGFGGFSEPVLDLMALVEDENLNSSGSKEQTNIILV
jgi:hypothetical protein